jgi:nucleotide-binding universal stress UspA family protein
MHTILVPTDYSIVARMAVQYAAALASATKSRLVLFHAYHLPIANSDLPGGITSSREEEKIHARKLNAVRRELEEAYGIEMSYRVAAGLAAEMVPKIAREIGADLIVMGTGRSQDIAKSLFGHVTTTVMHRASVPLLVVPEGVAFEHPKNIVLAADFEVKSSKVSLGLLKDLVRHFESTVYVLHVAKPLPAWSGVTGAVLVENRLEDLRHVYQVVEDDDPAHGIEQYLADYKPDWLVMLPHKYSFLEGIFHKSCTDQVAQHARIPLLVLPEKEQ